MMKKVGLLAIVMLSACAQKPEAIQASYVSPATYEAWSCPQLAQEVLRVENALAVASKQQRDTVP